MSETLQKEVISPGNGIDKPRAGDVVTMDYTGWLYEKNQTDNRGKVYGHRRCLLYSKLTTSLALIHPKTVESLIPGSALRRSFKARVSISTDCGEKCSPT